MRYALCTRPHSALRTPRDTLPTGATAIALQTPPDNLTQRINAHREREPDPFVGEPAAIEAHVREAATLIAELEATGAEASADAQTRYLHETAARHVRFARARLDRDRHNALEILQRLFSLGSALSAERGSPPAPDGRYEGELIGLSTGLLSDPLFEWLTRIYLPWQGKTFDAATNTGDNIFSENVWSRGMSMFGWPEYRVPTSDLPGRVRVFPFKSSTAPSIEHPTEQILRLDYHDSPNPLPLRRMTEELVELPGGYLLGKTHMRGIREHRRVGYFALTRAP